MPEPSPALRQLAERLHVETDRIAHLDRLDAGTLEGFGSLLARAQDRDAAEIDAALQETLRFVPRILRGRVKKMLFPEEH